MKILTVKETEERSVHQEFESTDGGGWFASGDHYMYRHRLRVWYFLGIPVWFKSEYLGRELYCKEEEI